MFAKGVTVLGELLDEMRNLLREGAALDTLEGRSERRVAHGLGMLIGDADDIVRQRACRELGEIISRREPPKIEDAIRRLLWRLNPESGDHPVGVPELLGEIGRRAPKQIESVVSVILYYLDDDKLRPGLLQAAGRIGQRLPGVVAAHVDEIASCLGDKSAVVSANAVLALRRTGGERAEEALRAVEGDAREVGLFCGNELRPVKLSELAAHDCGQTGGLCFVTDKM